MQQREREVSSLFPARSPSQTDHLPKMIYFLINVQRRAIQWSESFYVNLKDPKDTMCLWYESKRARKLMHLIKKKKIDILFYDISFVMSCLTVMPTRSITTSLCYCIRQRRRHERKSSYTGLWLLTYEL